MATYILFYFMFYFTFGSGILYFSQFFNAIGLTGSELGVIFATGSFMAMIFQPMLGYINDKTKQTKKILMLLIIAIFTSLLFMNYTTSFIGILILYTLYSIAAFCKMPLMDTASLSTDYTFGKIRLWGSIGFAAGGLVSGKVVSIFGSESFLYLGMISSIITAMTVIKITEVRESIEKTSEKVDIKKLFSNKKYLIFIVVAMLFLGTNNGHNSYFGVYFKEIGGSMTMLGVTIFMMTLSEVPLIGLSTKLVTKKSAEFVVTLSLIVIAVRWGLYYFLPEPMVITGIFLLQGASVGLFFGAANLFVRDIVEKNTLSTAIMIFMAAGSLGGMFVQYISGIIIENTSPVNIYALFSILTFIGYGLMLINKKVKRSK